MIKKNRILIVDDDEEITSMFSSFFSTRGYVTEVEHNGENALATTLVFKPNLIILDIMMPKINGFDVLDILKNTIKTSGIPILVLSSLSGNEDKDKAKKLGSDAYMEKSSVDLEAILVKVNELIKQS